MSTVSVGAKLEASCSSRSFRGQPKSQATYVSLPLLLNGLRINVLSEEQTSSVLLQAGAAVPERQARHLHRFEWAGEDEANRQVLFHRGRRDEFYRRAKTWYKAEIDRLLHLERVEKDKPEVALTTQYPADKCHEGDGISSPAVAPSRLKVPTRVQPARAAKRKAGEQLSTSRAPSRTRKKLAAKSHVPGPAPGKERGRPECAAEPETKGDYALAAYDWAQFLSGNNEEHGRSPWSYIQFQGLDVAYFVMRLERAVRRKTSEILARNEEPVLSPRAAQSPSAVCATSETAHHREKEKIRGSNKEKAHPQRRIRNSDAQFRCMLLDDQRYTAPAPFTPKAALAPGEDWRPPTTATTTTTTITSPAKAGDKTKTANGGLTETTPAVSGSKPGISWAADEVRRRDELNKKAAAAGAAAAAAAGLAPEAEMEVSPTMGRWQVRARKLEAEGQGSKELPVEDLEANVVEVSGLKFAVDLCACPFEGGMEAGEEGLRIVMMY